MSVDILGQERARLSSLSDSDFNKERSVTRNQASTDGFAKEKLNVFNEEYQARQKKIADQRDSLLGPGQRTQTLFAGAGGMGGSMARKTLLGA